MQMVNFFHLLKGGGAWLSGNSRYARKAPEIRQEPGL